MIGLDSSLRARVKRPTASVKRLSDIEKSWIIGFRDVGVSIARISIILSRPKRSPQNTQKLVKEWLHDLADIIKEEKQ